MFVSPTVGQLHTFCTNHDRIRRWRPRLSRPKSSSRQVSFAICYSHLSLIVTPQTLTSPHRGLSQEVENKALAVSELSKALDQSHEALKQRENSVRLELAREREGTEEVGR